MSENHALLSRLKPYRTLLLAVVVLLPVEAASSWSLFSWYLNFEPPLPAALVAAAFCTLQVTLLLLAAQPLSPATHRWLLAGVAILLTVTALANVGNAYLRADTLLPAGRLAHVMGLGSGAASLTVAVSWICGGAIPAVGLVAWSGLAQHLRLERERGAEARAALREAMRALHETAPPKETTHTKKEE